MADFYDRFHGGDYSACCDYMEAVFGRFLAQRPCSILDIACGTGSLALTLAKRGYEVTGLDVSSAMLREARAKSRGGMKPIRYVHAGMREFDLGRKFDAALCVNGFSHLVRVNDVLSHFRTVRRHLNPGGIYVFDFSRKPRVSDEGQEWTYRTRPFTIIDLVETRKSRDRAIVKWEYHLFIISRRRVVREVHDISRSREYLLVEIRKLVNRSGLRVVGVFADREATKRPRKVRESDVSPVVVARRS